MEKEGSNPRIPTKEKLEDGCRKSFGSTKGIVESPHLRILATEFLSGKRCHLQPLKCPGSAYCIALAQCGSNSLMATRTGEICLTRFIDLGEIHLDFVQCYTPRRNVSGS